MSLTKALLLLEHLIQIAIGIGIEFFELRQERLILDADSYCQQNLINKLRTKPLP